MFLFVVQKSAEPESSEATPAADDSKSADAKPPEKKKPKVKSVDLEVTSQTSSLDATAINSLQEKEVRHLLIESYLSSILCVCTSNLTI